MYSCNQIQGTLDGERVSVADICFDYNSTTTPTPLAVALPRRTPARARPATRKADPLNQQLSQLDGTTAQSALATGHPVERQPTSRDHHESAAPSSTTADSWINQLSALTDFPEDDPAPHLPVYVAERTTVPPHCRKFLLIALPRTDFLSKNLLFSPNEKLYRRHLIVQEGVFTRNQKLLPVTNNSPYPVNVEVNMILGWLSLDCECISDCHESYDICNMLASAPQQTTSQPPPKSVAPAASPVKGPSSDTPDLPFDINPDLPQDDQRLLRLVLKRFQHCFVTAEKEVGLLRDVPGSKLRLNEERLIRTPPYKLSPAELNFLKEQLQGLEEGGLVTRSKSLYRNPIIVTRKSDGQFKAVWDFRKLNKLLANEPYDALPMESLLEKAHGYEYFGVLDLKLAYLQCPLDAASRKFTAFQIPGIGTFEFNGIPIGVKTAPALFQYIMDYIFSELRDKFPVISYFDDNLLCAHSVKELAYLLHCFLSLVDKHSISLSAKKCSFGYQQCKFLGYVLKDGQITQPDSRLQKIRDLQPPSDYKTVMSVCGVFNQLRRFVPNYADIASPITSLQKKSLEFHWGPLQEAAFAKIKNILLKNLPLYGYNPNYPTYLYVDASHQAAGASLFQKRPGEVKLALIECFSRKWHKNERNWPIFHKEYASAALALGHFRHLLLGKRFTLLTDSKPLTAYATMKPEGRLAKFCLVLSQYDFDIRWIEGRKNVFADVMSRLCPTEEPPTDFECMAESILFPVNAISTVPSPTQQGTAQQRQLGCLPTRREPPQPGPYYFTRSAAAAATTTAPTTPPSCTPENNSQPPQHIAKTTNTTKPAYCAEDLSYLMLPFSVSKDGEIRSFPEYFRGAQLTDEELRPIMEQLALQNDGEIRPGRSYHLKNGVLLHNQRLVAPSCIRHALLYTAHDLSGHHGQPKTLRAILDRGFVWKKLHEDVRSYCSTCSVCQSTKHPARPPQGFLHSTSAQHPFDCLAIDYCGPLTPSGTQRFTYILLITDCFTHFTYAYKTTACTSAKTIACLKDLFLKTGLCRRIIHDDATYFTSHDFRSFLASHNIIQISAPRYAHWVVGIVESRVKMLKFLLATYCFQESEWASLLALCVFFINSGYLSSIGTSPFKALYGYHPLWPADLQYLPSCPITLDQLQQSLRLVRRHIVSTWSTRRKTLKRRFDNGRQEIRYFHNQRVRICRIKRKFGIQKFVYQPAKIVARVSRVVYLVKAKRHGKFSVFPVHVRHIAPFFKRPVFT